MADCCLIKKVATVEVYENKNEVRAYGFMAGDRNTPVMEVRFKHLWGESNLSSCKLRWIIVDDVGSLLVGEVPIQSDNTALINLPNELFTGDRRMKVQLTVASCDGERILNLQQFTDLKVINSLASNEVVEPVYDILINKLYDETFRYLKQLDDKYNESVTKFTELYNANTINFTNLYDTKYASLNKLYLDSRRSLEDYMHAAENGGNANSLQGNLPRAFSRVENTIEELVNSANSKYREGDVVELNGYYTAGDGAGHKRKIEATDDGSGVQLANGLWANIVHNGEVNLSWFGVLGSGAENEEILVQKAIDTSMIVNIDRENIIIRRSIILKDRLTLKGNYVNQAFGTGDIFNFKCYANLFKAPVDSTSVKKLSIKNITADNLGSDTIGVFENTIRESIIEENSFIRFGYIFGSEGLWNICKIMKNYFGNLKIGLFDNVPSNTVNFVDSIISHNYINGFPQSPSLELIKFRGANFNLSSNYIDFAKTLIYLRSGTRNGCIYSNQIDVAMEGLVMDAGVNSTSIFGNSFYNITDKSEEFLPNVEKGITKIAIRMDHYGYEDISIMSNNFHESNVCFTTNGYTESCRVIGNTFRRKSGYDTRQKELVDRFRIKLLVNATHKNFNTYFDFFDSSCEINESIPAAFVSPYRIYRNYNGFASIFTTKNQGDSIQSSDLGREVIQTILTNGKDTESPPVSAKGYMKYDYATTKPLFWSGHNWKYADGNTPSLINTKELDTPYYTTKMQQEGVYEDFITYMDEKTEYDRLQREAEKQPEGVMMLPVIEEPQPSEKLLAFKEKYLG